MRLTIASTRLNGGGVDKRDFGIMPAARDECVDPVLGPLSTRSAREPRGVSRRQETITSGYTTTDDWGSDGMNESNSSPTHRPSVLTLSR